MKCANLIGLFAIGLLIIMLACSLIQNFLLSSSTTQAGTVTAEFLLNGGYPFGHPTSLPGEAIDRRMTLTAMARGTGLPTPVPTVP